MALKGAFVQWVSQINVSTLGFVIVAMFVLTWAVALLIWRFAHVEERWAMHGEPSQFLRPDSRKPAPTAPIATGRWPRTSAAES